MKRKRENKAEILINYHPENLIASELVTNFVSAEFAVDKKVDAKLYNTEWTPEKIMDSYYDLLTSMVEGDME